MIHYSCNCLMKQRKGNGMQVIFVGGAQGVGASCLAIEIADQWIVVDAGVRVDRKSDPLPDLALLEGKDVRAIFVTHAHADHIGALPLLHQAFPHTPIFTSRGTALLMEVMLSDALKVMARRAVEEMELPLYPETLIGSMLTCVRPLPVGEPFTVSNLPGITVHASRAGHIAGAVSLGFVSNEGSLVVSGDISITPQRTVQGAVAPPVKHPDLLVLESTYGARLHPNRQAEELRLAQAVAARCPSSLSMSMALYAASALPICSYPNRSLPFSNARSVEAMLPLLAAQLPTYATSVIASASSLVPPPALSLAVVCSLVVPVPGMLLAWPVAKTPQSLSLATRMKSRPANVFWISLNTKAQL
jgi:glyoxylase-like metal-dependent hydrolase (beta-lactamase superfamily II)